MKAISHLSSFKDVCINKPPLPTDVFHDVKTPISCINTMDIDDTEDTVHMVWKILPGVL